MDTIARAWMASHKPVTQEVQADLPIIEGELPGDLRGVLYRNGPGRFSVGNHSYDHLFDGDGLVLRFALGAGSSDSRPRVRYRNRFVRTREFVEEERAGRMLYRGFGTNLPGGIFSNFLCLRFKNAANTSVVYHPLATASVPRGRLLALWEGGLPHLLDPVTLDTLAREDFDGGLKNRGPWLDRFLAPELPFSAHPKVDHETGDLYNFGVTSGAKPKLLLYKIDAEGPFSTLRELTLPYFAFVHDFCLTPNYFVFFVCPMKFDEKGFLLGFATVADSLRPVASQDVPTRILLVPRDGGEPIWQEASPCFIFHFANAYEDAAGQVVADGCRQSTYPGFPRLSEALAGRIGVFPRATLTRFTLDPKAGSGVRVKEEPIGGHPSELPTVATHRRGRQHRYVYAVGPSHLDDGQPRHHNITTSIVRHDTVTRTAIVRDFSEGKEPGLPGEPIFVERTGEGGPSDDDGDGYLLSVVYHGKRDDSSDEQRSHRSALHVLDARDLSTVCVALLPHHVPLGFHGAFVRAEACPPGWHA